ncbi:hypothetical protein [Streptomyces sp. 3N207]|uniref:hypothetical protein n=1 Tax=Streptomyces sp. 3N207 TaxID=3457417 RepID=UPI003FD68D2F
MMDLFGRGRRRRAAAAQWEALRDAAVRQAGQNVHIAWVESIYQRARAGDKAWIIWQRTGVRQDTWFHGRAPCPAGTYVLLGGSVGFGPHNNNPRVLYVSPSAVRGTASAKALKEWQRQADRG